MQRKKGDCCCAKRGAAKHGPLIRCATRPLQEWLRSEMGDGRPEINCASDYHGIRWPSDVAVYLKSPISDLPSRLLFEVNLRRLTIRGVGHLEVLARLGPDDLGRNHLRKTPDVGVVALR